jgi:hypothetical protein
LPMMGRVRRTRSNRVSAQIFLESFPGQNNRVRLD